jgi:hypothetical protein
VDGDENSVEQDRKWTEDFACVDGANRSTSPVAAVTHNGPEALEASRRGTDGTKSGPRFPSIVPQSNGCVCAFARGERKERVERAERAERGEGLWGG